MVLCSLIIVQSFLFALNKTFICYKIIMSNLIENLLENIMQVDSAHYEVAFVLYLGVFLAFSFESQIGFAWGTPDISTYMDRHLPDNCSCLSSACGLQLAVG